MVYQPTLVTDSMTHFSLISFLSLSHFTPQLLPGITSQINYLYLE